MCSAACLAMELRCQEAIRDSVLRVSRWHQYKETASDVLFFLICVCVCVCVCVCARVHVCKCMCAFSENSAVLLFPLPAACYSR